MKSNLDKFFKTDKEVEKTGVWFNITDEAGFLVRPFKPSNPQIKQAMTAHYKPYAHQVAHGTLDPEKEREILTKVFVNACLVDWKGIEIDGEPAKFSKELALKYLLELPELFNTLMDQAQDFKNYKEEFEAKTEVGNS
jgi:hypothetical protein